MESLVSRALALESSEKSQETFTKAKYTSKKHEAVETLVSTAVHSLKSLLKQPILNSFF